MSGVHRQYNDPDGRPLVFDEPCRLQSIHHRHADIHQHHVRPTFLNQAHGLSAISRLTHHLNLRPGFVVSAASLSLAKIRLDFVRLDFVRLDFVRLDFVRLDFVHLDFVRLDFVRLDFVRLDFGTRAQSRPFGEPHGSQQRSQSVTGPGGVVSDQYFDAWVHCSLFLFRFTPNISGQSATVIG
jgi:hypothetical protein